MIIWGGLGNTGYQNEGARYNPATDVWTATSTNGAPVKRYSHSAVWTGSEMIIWGGVVFTPSFVAFNDGARYNPATDAWVAMTTSGGPSGRSAHSAVWTGSEMIIWGGAVSGSFVNSGANYYPTTNGWATTAASGLTGRAGHTAVWTGSELIVWGGQAFSGSAFNDGSHYSPTLGGWTGITASGAPTARYSHTAVWTGNVMLVWGGGNNLGQYFNNTYSYQLPSTMYLYLKP
jgi:N-acetylneuraminic acid mutarotase